MHSHWICFKKKCAKSVKVDREKSTKIGDSDQNAGRSGQGETGEEKRYKSANIIGVISLQEHVLVSKIHFFVDYFPLCKRNPMSIFLSFVTFVFASLAENACLSGNTISVMNHLNEKLCYLLHGFQTLSGSQSCIRSGLITSRAQSESFILIITCDILFLSPYFLFYSSLSCVSWIVYSISFSA